MSRAFAVSFKGVFKKYKLFSSLKERLKESLHPSRKQYHHEFWALKDISLEIPRGITFGIIGQNGSGKSTLLQILCSVLKPTQGEVDVDGKVAALLELGAGYNPEFTGRENVLLNGMLMGLSREEMGSLLPSIEEFADIGEFFDQPVKIYSSGMFARIAFSGAINVDPDILVVDEALSVGDARFQQKCFHKFQEFQKAGKTIIFVTHDLQAVAKHCDKAMILEKGKTLVRGNPKEIIHQYLQLLTDGKVQVENTLGETEKEKTSPSELRKLIASPTRPSTELEKFFKETHLEDHCSKRRNYNKNEYKFGDQRAKVVDFLVVSQGVCEPLAVYNNDLVDIYVKVKFSVSIDHIIFGFKIKTVDGIDVFGKNTLFFEKQLKPMKASETGIYKISVRMGLQRGDYFFNVGVSEGKTENNAVFLDRRFDLIHLNVEGNELFTGLVKLDNSLEECDVDTF